MPAASSVLDAVVTSRPVPIRRAPSVLVGTETARPVSRCLRRARGLPNASASRCLGSSARRIARSSRRVEDARPVAARSIARSARNPFRRAIGRAHGRALRVRAPSRRSPSSRRFESGGRRSRIADRRQTSRPPLDRLRSWALVSAATDSSVAGCRRGAPRPITPTKAARQTDFARTLTAIASVAPRLEIVEDGVRGLHSVESPRVRRS